MSVINRLTDNTLSFYREREREREKSNRLHVL